MGCTRKPAGGGSRVARGAGSPPFVCAGLQRWEMGLEIAKLFSFGLPLDLREAAGRFYLARAQSLCAAGDKNGAKAELWSLSEVWPEGRELALKSKALAAVW